MENKQVRVGVGVFVMRRNEMLIGLRKGAHGEGTWCFPGGHLEFNESWEQCGHREVMEETGLITENIRFVAVTNDRFEKEEKHYVTIFMMSDYVDGEVQLMEPDKFSEWKWCTWDTLPENIFLPTLGLKKQGFDPLNT